jgi:membrane dipeptidase
MVASSAAEQLQSRSIVWDNHACLPLHGKDPSLMLARHRAAGFTFVSVNLGDAEVNLETMVRLAAYVRAFVRENPGEYLLAGTADDIVAAKQSGRTAIAFDVEGMRVIGEQLSLVSFLQEIGVRWMSVAYNRANQVGSGCHDAHDNGLTELGRDILKELTRAGVIICCSHTGYRTAREVMEQTTVPIIFSHSNAGAIFEHPRNIPDDLARRCAATGGVIGLNGLNIFLGKSGELVDLLATHIEHFIDLVGAEHVGLGLDFVYENDELSCAVAAAEHIWPPGYGYGSGLRCVPPESLPRLTEALLSRGYSEDTVAGILGENFLRIARQVWRQR